MHYRAELDPNNITDLRSYNETAGMLSDEWHENDQEFIIETMAEWLTGMQDSYAKEKFTRLMMERAQKIMDRAVEAAIAEGTKP